jgi:biotin synthase
MSIKTGGCPEDCGYCSQSSKHKDTTGLKATKLADLDEMYQAAVRAKAAGSTRFCMGAAWRGPSQVGAGQFARVLDATTRIRALGLEVCATLGMLNAEQAVALRAAGLSAYNHNLDTSPEFYGQVTTSRRYEDRLETLAHVRAAGLSVCCGGILGLGEADADRVGLLQVLASLPDHPESVPINALVAVAGTPLADRPPVGALDMVRAIAAARVVMPRSVVRLSAGRVGFSAADQALCFLAGANSIFSGDTLLTTPNNEASEDAALMSQLGLHGRPAFVPYAAGGPSSTAPSLRMHASAVTH